jgi:hypothetical protein
MMDSDSSREEAIILAPDEFELSNDGRMVELRLLHDQGADLVWAMRIEPARALAGDLLIVAEQAETGSVQS